MIRTRLAAVVLATLLAACGGEGDPETGREGDQGATGPEQTQQGTEAGRPVESPGNRPGPAEDKD